MTTPMPSQSDTSRVKGRDRKLTGAQRTIVVAMQILFFIFGLLLLLGGGVRVGITLYGGSGGTLEEFAGRILGEGDYFNTPTLIFGGVLAVIGYGLLYGVMALGAKEPPAWQAGRNGLIGLISALTSLVAFLYWQDFSNLVPIAVVWIVVSVLGIFLLTQFTGNDFRLALGAARLRRRELNIFTFRNISIVLLTSTLMVLGIVYAILTDNIELPVSETSPNELLFVTDFEDFNDEWDVNSSKNPFGVEEVDGNNRLVVTIDSLQYDDGVFSTLNTRKFGDFDLRVTSTQLQSPSNHDNLIGILFRYRDTQNYYRFDVSGDGYYSITKVEDGVADRLSAWMPTTEETDAPDDVNPTILRPGLGNTINDPQDAVNEIRIVGIDDRFWFFVNGYHLQFCLRGDLERAYLNPFTYECVSDEVNSDYFQDSSFSQGYIGLSAGTTASTYVNDDVEPRVPVVIAFENLLILGPEEPNLNEYVSFPESVIIQVDEE